MKRLLFLLCLLLAGCSSGYRMYIGSYSGNVYSVSFDGAFGTLDTVAGLENPSYLALDQNDIYVVSETDSLPRLYKVNGGDALTCGAGPCHVSVGHGYAVTSNYSGGSMSVFKLPLGNKPTQLFHGSIGGPDSLRQCVPHVHCAVFSPDGHHLLASDFSADRLLCFDVLEDSLKLSGTIGLARDTGPRHILFASDTVVYVIGELSGNVTVLSFPSGTIMQEVEADPKHTRASADIRLSPDGRYLYASNRLGADGVAVFEVLPQGALQKVGYTYTASCPRNIAVSPDGNYLFVASQSDDVIEVYEIDKKSGLLSPVSVSLHVGKPVCIVFDKLT